MKKIIAAIVLFAGMLTPVCAQQLNLTADEKEQIVERIKDKLEDFQYNLGTMANKSFSQQTRQGAYKTALSLFIGKCEPYEVTDLQTGRVERRKAVQMETSSVNRENVKKQPMKQYFNNILNNRTYSNIKIEQAGAILVDNFRKTGNGKYEAVAHICQDFVGYNDKGEIRYSDRTEKGVKIYVDVYDVPNQYGEIERIVDVKLGDMKVLSTVRL